MLDEKTLSFLQRELYADPMNYELYLLMGSKLEDQNPYLSCLAYENAEYFCEVKERVPGDLAQIRQIKKKLCEDRNISIPPVSIIILSYNTLEYTKGCIESIRRTVKADTCEIIVVENGSTDGSREWLETQSDLKLIVNQENVGFPAGCNQGIKVAKEENDIFLLNSDTVLLLNSLFYLRMGLYRDPQNGTAGSVSNATGNYQVAMDFPDDLQQLDAYVRKKNLPSAHPCEQKTYLTGFALLIRREALNKVGLLDERYSPGYFEDNDYGIRMLEAGYHNVCCWNSFIFHYGSKSFGTDEKRDELVEHNLNQFKEKWGFHPWYYTYVREEIIKMIQCQTSPLRVLEVGCGFGETLGRIQYLYPDAEIHGVEIMENVAAIAKNKLPIMCDNIETMDLPFDKEYFDYIIFADVLEHLVSPQTVLKKIHPYLKPNGHVLTSIPNIMNASVIYGLLHGNFTYQDSGILDRTHLRFFTHKEILKLFAECGYEIDQLSGTGADCEMTTDYADFFDQLLQIEGVEDRKFFDVYQYLVSARKI